jgi:hypothetical protein
MRNKSSISMTASQFFVLFIGAVLKEIGSRHILIDYVELLFAFFLIVVANTIKILNTINLSNYYMLIILYEYLIFNNLIQN